jgi:hypothetical protein
VCNNTNSNSLSVLATATDRCDGPINATFVDTRVDNALCPYEFDLLRAYTATDSCGNSATGVQQFAFTNPFQPTIVVPANTDVGCGAASTPNVTGFATASHPVRFVVMNQLYF